MASITSINRNSQSEAPGCGICNFKPLCLAGALDPAHLDRNHGLGQLHVRRAGTGEGIYWAGAKFENIYAVRAGCLKTTTVDNEGREHIRSFHLPGDLVGLDAISAAQFPSNAVAVAASEVCVIPYAQLARLVSDIPALQKRMFEMMSQQLCVSLALAGDFSAEQRVSAFLLHLYQRLARRGLASGGDIRLAMPRRDIAAYLRLAMETVSRVLGRFECDGSLEVSVKDIRLVDMPALWELAEPVGICEEPALLPRRHMPASRRPPVGQRACA